MVGIEELKRERRKKEKKPNKAKEFLATVAGKFRKKKKKQKRTEKNRSFKCHVNDECQLHGRPRQPSPPPENNYSESISESLIDSEEEAEEISVEEKTKNDAISFVFPLPSRTPTPSPPPIPPRPASLAAHLDLEPRATPTMYSSIDLSDSGPVTPSSIFSDNFPPPIPPRRPRSATDPPPIPPRRLPPGHVIPYRRARRHSVDDYLTPIEEILRRRRELTAIAEDQLLTLARPRARSFDVGTFLARDCDPATNRHRSSVDAHTYVSINGSIVAGSEISDVNSLLSFGSDMPPSVSRSGSASFYHRRQRRRSRSLGDLRIEEEGEEKEEKEEEELLESVVRHMSDNVQEWFRTGSFHREEETRNGELLEERCNPEIQIEDNNTGDGVFEAEAVTSSSGSENDVTEMKENHFDGKVVTNEDCYNENTELLDMPYETVSGMRSKVMDTRKRVASYRKGVKHERYEMTANGNGQASRQSSSARNKRSRVLHSASKLLLMRQKTSKSASRHVRIQLEKAAANRSTKLGHNVGLFIRNHKDSALDPQNLVRIIREFMNQLKEYLLLVRDSELAMIVRKESDIENVELDAVVEGALVRSVLKPLYKTIKKNFANYYKSTGAAQQLSSCIQVASKLSTDELRIREGLIPPQGPSLDQIRFHFQKMQATHSPLAKLEHLLAAVDIVYQSVKDSKSNRAGESLALGADDFLPIFIWVLVHTGFEQAEFESDYLWGLLDPALMSGEGGYYLTTLSGALMAIRQITTKAKPKHASRRLPCIGDLQGLLRVEVPVDHLGADVTCFKTFQIDTTMTVKAACAVISQKLNIEDPENFSLFKVVGNEATELIPTASPQVIKMDWTLEDAENETDAPTAQRYFSYRRVSSPSF